MNDCWIKLQAGMILRAKKEVRTSDRCWNRPNSEYYPAGTVVLPGSGSYRGDTGAKIIGKFENDVFVPEDGANNFFREGHTTACPYDRGSIDPQIWEVIGQLDGDELDRWYRQAPHLGLAPLVITNKNGEFVFEEGVWEGYRAKLLPKRAQSEERSKRDLIREIGRTAAGFPAGPLYDDAQSKDDPKSAYWTLEQLRDEEGIDPELIENYLDLGYTHCLVPQCFDPDRLKYALDDAGFTDWYIDTSGEFDDHMICLFK